MIRDTSAYIPSRDSLHCATAEDPYRVAWEAASTLPVPQAIAEVVSRCGLPKAEASLLVFCELQEDCPVLPSGRRRPSSRHRTCVRYTGGVSGLRWRLAADDSGQPSLFNPDDLLARHVGRGEFRGLEFLHVNARRIINEVPAVSRMPFRYTINAYRGCSHACAYCFARPTHEYLGLGTGEDFERRIVVKINAVERLRAELAHRRWAGDHIAMGTNTDPYQRCEGRYHLTRGIVQTLSEARNPFSILTKSTLVLRDLDLLSEAARRTDVTVNLSIGTLDEDVWRLTEPGTPHPRQRVAAVARLNEAGVRCGVLVAPVIPGLSDRPSQVEQVVRACLDAGAVSISPIALHLRPGVKEHWMAWLSHNRADLVASYQGLYGSRSYLPAAVQQGLSETAGSVTRVALGRGRNPRGVAPPPPAGSG